MAQAADERMQNFGGFARRGVVALHQQQQFAVRKDLALNSPSGCAAGVLGRREMLDLTLMFDLTTRQIDHGSVFERIHFLGGF